MKDREYQEVCKPLSKYIQLQYPDVLFHFDLAGNKLTTLQAVKNKAIQKPGFKFPDLQIIRKGKPVLFLELKHKDYRLKSGGIKSTQHIKEQKASLNDLERSECYALFACGFEEAKEIIDWYMK